MINNGGLWDAAGRLVRNNNNARIAIGMETIYVPTCREQLQVAMVERMVLVMMGNKHNINHTPLAGLEPAIFGLEIRRLVH